MNHRTAVKIDGGWRYATLSKRGGGPLGYCAEHEAHATEIQARECFSQYLRDGLQLDGRLASWSDCQVCRGPAKTFASTRGDSHEMAVLCDEHLTEQHAITAMRLDQPAGDSWQS